MADDMLGGLTPEELQALLATNGDPAKLQDLQGQKAMADKLRAGAFEDHPGITVGHQYFPDVAGSLAAGAGAMYGKHLDKKATADQDALFASQAANSKAFINALLNRGKSTMPTVDPATGLPVKKDDQYLAGTPTFGDY